jgi:TonB family protein
MFETSVINAQSKAAPRRLGLFSISLIAHTAVILGVAAVSVASVEFPTAAPDEVANAPIFMPIQVPPPLGNPNGGAPPRPAVTPPQRPETPAPSTQITAPPAIPNDIPVTEAPATGDPTSDATGPADGTGTVPGPVGVPWGVDGGVGDIDTPPVVDAVPAIEDKVYVPGGEVKSPVLIRRVEPGYPEVMRRTRMNATVVVKCVIDKNGNVRDPQIVVASMPPFNDAVMNAVRQWKYQPGSYRGQAVDTYLNLTVTFGVR